MRLVLVDLAGEHRQRFYPLALSRPIWELRSGMFTLAEKLIRALSPDSVACFVPHYMAQAYAEQCAWPVNDTACLEGDDLVLVNPRVRADGLPPLSELPEGYVCGEEKEVLLARVSAARAHQLPKESIGTFLAAVCETLRQHDQKLKLWNYTWELVLENDRQLAADFAAAGQSGLKGAIEEPIAIRGSRSDVFVAPTATLHPMVVIDASEGPVYIDQEAEIHSFTRIEGPCYVGRKSILLGAKCRMGNTIGPVCRIGGEVEQSIIQGYSNKYHDGFLGHAYVGEWVNLGALTTNSDLKNDYSNVEVYLDGKHAIDTGSTKVGSLIGDHTKTSIGTLLNTGAYVGAMCVITATGKPLPKYIPSFSWFVEGVVTKGFGRRALYRTAEKVLARRGQKWTKNMEQMWEEIYRLTAPQRDELVAKGRRILAGKG